MRRDEKLRGLRPIRQAKRAAKKRQVEESGGYYHLNFTRDLPRLLYHNAKKLSKREGIPFGIKPSDIVIPALCPVLGIPLKLTSGPQSNASATLDRIVPELGYMPGNIAVMSMRANRLKSDGTADEFLHLAAYLATIDDPLLT